MAEDKIKQIRDDLRVLAIKYPIFGTVALQCKIKLNDPNVETLAIDDSLNLYVNYDFYDKLSKDEKEAVLQHELLHVLLGHTKVRPSEKISRLLSNIAMDAVINHLIYRATVFTIMTEWLTFKYNDTIEINIDNETIEIKDMRQKTWADIYDILNKNDKLKQKVLEMEQIFDIHAKFGKKTNKNWGDELEKGLAINRLAGKSGGLAGELEIILYDPKVNWREVLKNAVKKTISGGYDWTRPNKKMKPHGMYLPATSKTKKVENVFVAIDVSGSINNDEARAFVSEVYELVKNVTKEANVMFFDTEILKQVIVKTTNDVRTKLEKIPLGGGTNFGCIFNNNKIKSAKKDDVLIFLTDGWDEYPKEARKNFSGKVLWFATDTTQYLKNHGDFVAELKLN